MNLTDLRHFDLGTSLLQTMTGCITIAEPIIGQTKKISVFPAVPQVMGLKVLDKVGTHIFFNYFFFWKKYNFTHLKGEII